MKAAWPGKESSAGYPQAPSIGHAISATHRKVPVAGRHPAAKLAHPDEQRRILKSGKRNSASRSCRGLRPQKLLLGSAASPHVASLGFGDSRLNEAGWGQPALPKFKLQAAPTEAGDFKNQRSVGPRSVAAMAPRDWGPTEPIGFTIKGLVGTSPRLIRIDRAYGLGGRRFFANWCSSSRV